MKNLLFLLLAATIVLSSCGKDDDCNDPANLASVIIGEWNVVGWDATVEFQEDGDFIDNDEVLVFNFNDVDMEYIVDSSTQMRIFVDPAEYMVTVQSFECNQINLSVAGFTYELTRN